MLEWLIIGGGIHGTHLSHVLVHGAGVPADRLRVVDPHPEPLAVWRRNTARCGMRHLRSPATHHIDLPILSLYRFAQERRSLPTPFIPLYNRPSLELFQAHALAVIQRHDLQRLRIACRALALRRTGDGLVAETTAGEIAARRVLLALGLGEQPCWPPWAEALHRQGAPVDHIFAPDFPPLGAPGNGPTLVVGGGITAVQTALAAAARFPGGVILLARHDLRASPYDFDPCWIGPKCLRRFGEADMHERRRDVDEARVRGSVTAEVLVELDRALETGRLALRRGRVAGAEAREGRIRLQLSDGPLWAGRIVLATGFRSDPPGGPLLDQIVRDFHLPRHSCGYPILSPDLHWGAGIYATGPLAELELGPCARNIVGARNAGRLLQGAAAQGFPPR